MNGIGKLITIIRIFFIPVFMAVLLSGAENGKFGRCRVRHRSGD